MKWATLLLQLLSLRSTFFETNGMVESARAAAEKGKRAAVFSGFAIFALFYFLAGTILLVVELGLQWDQAGRWYFSGLLFSSFFLLFLSVSILAIGALVASKDSAPPPPEPASDLKKALEEVAVSFLKQLSKKLKED